MKKTMRKIGLGGSIVALIVCLVLVTGSTFSLFTTKDENDITVNAAKVELTAKIDTTSLALYSKGVVQTGKFENSGTAEFTNDDKTLTLYNVTPGDKAEFNIVVTNASTVDIQYRIKWTYTGELADVLVVKVGETPLTNGMSEWAKWTPDEDDTKTLKLSVELPIDVKDDYQEKTAEIDFYIEAVQANGTAEYDPTAFVNTAAGLQAAIDSGATEIILNEDIELDSALVFGAADNAAAPKTARRFADKENEENKFDGIVLDLNGNKIVGATSEALVQNQTNLLIIDGTIENTALNGGATINNKGTLILDDITVIGAPIASDSGYPAYCITNAGNLTVEEGTEVSADRGCLFLSGTGETVINGGSFTNNDIAPKLEGRSFTSHVVVVGYGANNKLIINGGDFKHLHTSTSGGVVINNWSAVTVEINGGNFSGGNYYGKWDNLSDYGYGSTKTPFAVSGGTFTGFDNNYLAEGALSVKNADGTYSIYANNSTAVMTLTDGAVLDLGGVEFAGTVVVEGNVTIKGDTKIKTLKATKNANITIEDGKTLTMNDFSFGASDNATAEYVITGGTVVANYGFFQHGTYALYSNFETGYMYYSYGSDITVYGTFHSQGKGDGLDYVRGKLTIANGGKSIHDKALWVGQPTSWGEMHATLVVEEGGYVQANSLHVYAGSTMLLDAKNIVDGLDNSVVYTTKNFEGTVVYQANDSDSLMAAVAKGETTVYLNDGEYDMPNFGEGKVNGVTFIGASREHVVIKLYNAPNGGDFCLAGSTATLENMTIVTEIKDWAGFQNAEDLTFNKCNFVNNLFLSGNATFNDCHFEVTTNHYNVWAYSANSRNYTAEFNNCVFDCVGKSIYIDGNANGSTTMKFKECEFNDKDGGATDKAAIETGTTYGAGAIYNVDITDCEFNGFAINPNGANTNSIIWANKNSMTTDKLNIVIDGVEVY